MSVLRNLIRKLQMGLTQMRAETAKYCFTFFPSHSPASVTWGPQGNELLSEFCSSSSLKQLWESRGCYQDAELCLVLQDPCIWLHQPEPALYVCCGHSQHPGVSFPLVTFSPLGLPFGQPTFPRRSGQGWRGLRIHHGLRRSSNELMNVVWTSDLVSTLCLITNLEESGAPGWLSGGFPKDLRSRLLSLWEMVLFASVQAHLQTSPCGCLRFSFLHHLFVVCSHLNCQSRCHMAHLMDK